MSLSFAILCAKCFRLVPPNSGGSVLSCGDIICSTCDNAAFRSSSVCPACDKEGVRALSLNENLPEEVNKNLRTDSSKELESIHEVLVFQVKYYKKTMKLMIRELHKRKDECENYKRSSKFLFKFAS